MQNKKKLLTFLGHFEAKYSLYIEFLDDKRVGGAQK